MTIQEIQLRVFQIDAQICRLQRLYIDNPDASYEDRKSARNFINRLELRKTELQG